MSDQSNDKNEYISNVVAESRQVGSTLYGQYSQATSDGSWEKREDGTIFFPQSKMEITPAGDVFGPYKSMTSFLQEHGLSGKQDGETNKFDSGHLVAAADCKKAGLDSDSAPCVMVDRSGHMNDLHGSAGFLAGAIYQNSNHMIGEHCSTYTSEGAPEWGERAASYIEANRAAFDQSLSQQTSESVTDLPTPTFSIEVTDKAMGSKSESAFDRVTENPSAADTQDSNASKY